MPVDKQPVPINSSEKEKLNPLSRVFSGTINGSGTLEIQVSRLSSESTLSKVIQMVNEAETKKSPLNFLRIGLKGFLYRLFFYLS